MGAGLTAPCAERAEARGRGRGADAEEIDLPRGTAARGIEGGEAAVEFTGAQTEVPGGVSG